MFNRSLPETINQVNTLIFSALFILSATAAVFLFTSGWVLTNPDRYKEALWESGAYPRLPSIAAEHTAGMFNDDFCRRDPETCAGNTPFYAGGDLPSFLTGLSETVWVDIYSELLTSNWAQDQAESALDQYFAYLHGDRAGLAVQISLEQPKERLRGEQGERVFRHILNAQPPCSADNLLRMLQAALQGSSLEAMPLCQIPDEYIGQVYPQVNQVMGDVAASFPDQVNLPDQENSQPAESEVTRSAFQDFRTLTFLSPLAPLALALLVVIFGVRSLKGMLLWLGVPLMFTGVLVFVISFPLASPISSLISSQFFGLQNVQYSNLLTTGYEASNYLSGVITSNGRTLGVAFAVTGFLLAAFSLVVPSRPN
jgi:hypothetical protein